MTRACCPHCRLLQPPARACTHCGRAAPVALAALPRARVEGITRVTRPPATGWRDTLALMGTALGGSIVGVGTGFLAHPLLGLVAGATFASFGYRKQFWRAALVRRPHLQPLPAPSPPTTAPLVGTARTLDRTLATDLAEGALAVATTITAPDGVLVRAIDAVPFWLVIDARRILVTGECWASSTSPVLHDRLAATLTSLDASDLPIPRARRRQVRVSQVTISPGDQLAVHGTIREEQLSGSAVLGGYRDTVVETLRGEPGAPIWIERL